MRAGDTRIKKVTVGIVIKPVGLKGELKVMPLTDNPERFVPGGTVWMSVPGGVEAAYTIGSVRGQKDKLVISLSGITSAEEAGKFRDREMFVPDSEVPPLPEGEYYQYQIIGLDVYYYDGRLLGKVKDIFPAGERDVYVVAGAGTEYMVPATPETVREVDLKAGRITLYRMEGYIE